MRICRDCKEEKALDLFVNNSGFKDGKDTLCKACNRKRTKAYRAAGKRNYKREYITNKRNNPKRLLADRKKYYDANLRNPRILKTKQELKLTKDACRERRRKNHTRPSWADLERIKTYYAIRDWLNYVTFGKHYQVDHVIPILGKDVCGLHVENNLAVVTASLNRSKSNKLMSAVCRY